VLNPMALSSAGASTVLFVLQEIKNNRNTTSNKFFIIIIIS